jgi:hypothetical protein
MVFAAAALIALMKLRKTINQPLMTKSSVRCTCFICFDGIYVSYTWGWVTTKNFNESPLTAPSLEAVNGLNIRKI